MRQKRVAAIAGICLLAIACKPSPRPLAVDVDACEVCRMVISDARYGGEVVLNSGRVHTFDSIECVASYVNALPDSTLIREILVSDFDRSELIALDRASFSSVGRGSPMGLGVVAHARESGVTPDTPTMTWDEVRSFVRERPLGTRADNSDAAHSGHVH